MNTKMTMTFSALIMGAIGIALSFSSDSILMYLGIEENRIAVFLMQILGSLYFGFAMLNWMSKSSIIGGIYNRPTTVANFAHFLIAALALLKGIISNPELPFVIWGLAIVYVIFGCLFGIILFVHPRQARKN
ncbi:hypothetical protein [Lutibacter maritimus]|uniref:Uncharacterized protein n=1 Tax=Lutibacter maritimus TaxID=593133 RepID=A0A1I6RYQ1_9FLAO|nr:hypothetical protein [Lutibacter maritimus]SFS69720.1 hypothetical protein SAMN04488006_2650 [Lutibacter maritimus]